jgi:hypothetical protein
LKDTVLLFLQKGGRNEEIIQKHSQSYAGALPVLPPNRVC